MTQRKPRKSATARQDPAEMYADELADELHDAIRTDRESYARAMHPAAGLAAYSSWMAAADHLRALVSEVRERLTHEERLSGNGRGVGEDPSAPYGFTVTR